MSDLVPVTKVPLDALMVSEVGKRGWLEWNGSEFFLAQNPTGIVAPPEPPVIPPDILEPDPSDPNPPPALPEASGETIYTVAGTYSFTVPLRVTELEAVIVAAGASGASGAMLNCCAGGGGQAGEVMHVKIPVTPGDVVQVVVGRGGGAVCGKSVSGNNGGNSVVKNIVAIGGQGGRSAGQTTTARRGRVVAANSSGAKYCHSISLGGGNAIGGLAQKTTSFDALGSYTATYGSLPHKVGGKGGSNGIGVGGNGGIFSGSGPGAEVSGGRAGTWPGGGGGGGGTDEGTGAGCSGPGADGGVYLFWGKGRLARFPSGVPIMSAQQRAGMNTEIEMWYVSTDTTTNNDCCVAPNTLIDMADGTRRPIAEVVSGDAIRAYDVVDHAFTVGIVDHVQSFDKLWYYRIHFDDNTVLDISDDHPMLKADGIWEAFDPDAARIVYKLYDLDIRRFAAATQFMQSGKRVIGVEHIEESCSMLTMSIRSSVNHNYVANGIIVHNRRCGGDAPGGF